MAKRISSRASIKSKRSLIAFLIMLYTISTGKTKARIGRFLGITKKSTSRKKNRKKRKGKKLHGAAKRAFLRRMAKGRRKARR